jgi:magnesium chelatase family protein
VDYEKLSGDRVGESSETLRARVQAARDIQSERFSSNGSSDIVCNADMCVEENTAILQIAGRRPEPDAGGNDSAQFIGAGISPHPEASAYDCGLSGCEKIQSVHLAEALQYRPKLMLG